MTCETEILFLGHPVVSKGHLLIIKYTFQKKEQLP